METIEIFPILTKWQSDESEREKVRKQKRLIER